MNTIININNQNIEIKILNIILTGSRLYGTHYNKGENPLDINYESDYDYRGIFTFANPYDELTLYKLPDEIDNDNYLEYIIEIQKKINEQLQLNVEIEDIKFYELKKFINLAFTNNPNIMDILFAPKEAILYESIESEYLLSQKELFLSKKCFDTFNGYADSQLKRIKGHNKWINQYPDINILIENLKDLFKEKQIDFNWISDNFSGQLATFITNENPQKNQSFKTISWEEFETKFSTNNKYIPLNEYRKPRLINYCFPRQLDNHHLNLNDLILSKNKDIISIENFLKTEASFRSTGENTYNIFDNGNGIFAKEGNIKKIESKTIGEFKFQMFIDKHAYKRDCDKIEKLWSWKTKRNVIRGNLEDKFSYDVKHASHLIRLILSSEKIFYTNKFSPKLEGDDLKLVKNVREGKYTYDKMMELVNDKKEKLKIAYEKSQLQTKPDYNKINTLYQSLKTNTFIMKKEFNEIHSLRKRFVKDFSLPITIMKSPIFEYFIELYEEHLKSKTNYEIFINDIKSFNSPSEYFSFYNKLRDTIIEHIKNKESFIKFHNDNLQNFKTQNKIQNGKIYLPENKDKFYLSIDLKKANFQSIKYYDETIIDNKETYQEFLNQFTNLQSIHKSKYIRQVIFGNLNPKKQQQIQKYLIDQIMTHLFLKTSLKPSDIKQFTSDEIILEIKLSYDDINKIKNLLKENFDLELHIDIFELDNIGNEKTNFFVKKYYIMNDIEKTFILTDKQKHEIKNLQGFLYPQAFKKYHNLPITENDKLFYYEGQLVKFLEESFKESKITENNQEISNDYIIEKK